jgi:hypothetical protein
MEVDRECDRMIDHDVDTRHQSGLQALRGTNSSSANPYLSPFLQPHVVTYEL